MTLALWLLAAAAILAAESRPWRRLRAWLWRRRRARRVGRLVCEALTTSRTKVVRVTHTTLPMPCAEVDRILAGEGVIDEDSLR